MADPVSPYELLRMSKPKAAPTVVTAYDLYSTAHSQSAYFEPQPAVPVQVNEPQENVLPSRVSTVPVRRTHYIADIKSRHDMAARRSSIRRM